MTYLAIPPLIESGFFKEAQMALRAVCAFHQTVGGDIGDMMSKACKMANYDKAMEIKRFGDRCTRSMQLALAQSEFPLLELVENQHCRADALAYIKLYKAGFLLESIPDISNNSMLD